MFRLLLFSILSTSAFLAAAPQPPPFPHPLVFEPNRGQTSPEVKWFARGSGYQLFITSNGITMKLNEPVEEAAVAKGSPVLRPLSEPAPASGPLRYSVLQMALSGSRAWEQVTGLDPTGGVSNYDGRDGNAALMNVPHYSRLKVAGVYDGIDLVFYSSDGELEYDFQVAPGADSRQIRMAFDGVSEMHLDNKSGDLVLKTAPGAELRHLRPKV